MRIETQVYNNIAVVALQGEFNAEAEKTFQDTVSSLVAADSCGIVLDMSKVSFIDSQGLEQLLWLKEFCQPNQCDVKLAALDENCHKILEITRVQSEFDIYGELSEAVKSFV